MISQKEFRYPDLEQLTKNEGGFLCHIFSDMTTAQLSQDQLLEQFSVLYLENHGGTFNGCLDSIHLSLEQFINLQVKQLVTTAIFDYRTSMNVKFTFLRGQAKRLWVTRMLSLHFLCNFLPTF